MTKPTLCILAVFFLAARGLAQPATSEPTSKPSVLEAKDTDKLKDSVGMTVTVKGEVSGTYSPRNGALLINFKDAKRTFTLMIPKKSLDDVKKGFDGDVEKALKGKTISATGEIKIYREKPEMEITKADQIKVEDK